MIIGNIAPIINESGIISGFNLTYITNTVTPFSMMVTSIFNACGRPFWGEVSDKIGVWKAMRLNFLITAILLIVLSFTYVNPWSFLIVVVWIYFCYGGVLTLLFILPSSLFIINCNRDSHLSSKAKTTINLKITNSR
jgi:OFA family oxalate/formate antiporter-like MFS transporter